MTTVAFRDGVIAADTMMSYGSVPHTIPGLKLFIAGQYAVGFSGDCRFVPLIKRWVMKGCIAGKDEFSRLWDDDWDIILMDKEGRLSIAFADCVHPVDQQFYAIGSGSKIALGALASGSSARDAVLTAARFDNYTNSVVEQITKHDLVKALNRGK